MFRKINLGVLILGLIIILSPNVVKAEELDLSKYSSTNLQEALLDEEISSDLGSYQETEEQINIYLFRGKGCSHCHEFLEYVATDLIKEYGEYFKVVSYEVWGNEDNAELFKKVATFMKDSGRGVPYIIIGDQSFAGYTSTMNDSIIAALKKAYENKYDVMEEIKNAPAEVEEVDSPIVDDVIDENENDNMNYELTSSSNNNMVIVGCGLVVVGALIIGGSYIWFTRKRK